MAKVTNLIRGGNRSHSHRRFMTFLDEVDAAYGDLQMHTEVRWMSQGKCLERFFALRSEIPLFLEDSACSDMSAYCRKLKDTAFLCDMAFLTDITSHLNNLNTKLQGRDQTVCDLYAHMTAFQRKLYLFKEGLSSHPLILTHFPTCEEMQKNVPQWEMLLHKYKADIERLQEQFKHHFQDFHAMQPRIALFVDPLLHCCQWATFRVAAGALRPAVWSVFSSEAQWEGNFVLESASTVPFSTPPRVCTLNDKYVWEDVYLWEQFFNNEAHHIKREKQAHGWHTFSSDADCMHKDWHWYPVNCAPAGKATSFSLKENQEAYYW